MPAALVLAAALAASPVTSFDALVARVIAGYGGEKALEGMKAFRETGTLQSPRGGARVVRVFARPRRLRVEIAWASGASEVRVLDGEEGYSRGEKVSGPPRDAMVLQAVRLDLPGLLLRHRKQLVDLGEHDQEGKTLRGIGIPLSATLALAVHVDPDTARIVRSEGVLPGPSGQMRFATVYSDFRGVEGLLFAFHEANFAAGQHTGETQLEKIELLREAPTTAFQP